MKNVIIFGAGNIGRSFMGQLFSKAGFKVTFIETNTELVHMIQKKKAYDLVIRKDGFPDKIESIGPVSAVDAKESERVLEELIAADYISSSVGLRALPCIIPLITKAALLRSQKGLMPLDLILAENIQNGRRFFFDRAREYFPEGTDPESLIGVIECSIGKMVPLMTGEDLKEDPLRLFAEEYNTLILDRRGFLTACPDIDGILPVENIQAYVDRKLYLHNLGHVAAAWFGFKEQPESVLISDVIRIPKVRKKVLAVMDEASRILLHLHPEEFSPTELESHTEDLIDRFSNRSLGDTVFRVGRDLERKLGKNDRVLGAALQAVRVGEECDSILSVFFAGLCFKALNRNGQSFARDDNFHQKSHNRTPCEIAKDICHLDESNPTEAELLLRIGNIDNRTI